MLSYLPGRSGMQRRTQTASPAPSPLQTALGEYGAFANAPMFESTFLEVTNKGEYVSIDNHTNLITMGVLASSVDLPLPDYLVIAQGEVKRMIPMDMVDLFVHNDNQKCLKVRLTNGRKYYLKLHASAKKANFLFDRWINFIYMLRSKRGIVNPAKTANTPKRMYSPPEVQISTETHGPSRPGSRINRRESNVERNAGRYQNMPLDVNHGVKDGELDAEGLEMNMSGTTTDGSKPGRRIRPATPDNIQSVPKGRLGWKHGSIISRKVSFNAKD